MRKIKPTSKYQTVSFPEPFYNEIKEVVIKHEKYRSIAEFVKEAVRDKMQSTGYKFGNDMDKILQLRDELILLSKKMENKDNRFKGITKSLEDQQDKLMEISPTIRMLEELPPKENEKLLKTCRELNITPSEHLRNLIKKYDKEHQKKNLKGNGFRG